MIPNFKILSKESISQKFIENGINEFSQACDFVMNLPIGKNSSRIEFEKIFEELKGTCSTKHGLLAVLALENNHPEIELMFGIYLMSEETHPQFSDFLSQNSLTNLPETHCFLRYNGKRYDFSSVTPLLEKIESKIVREQRIDPPQVGEWKEVIHKDYLTRWLKRKPEIGLSLEEIWVRREENYCTITS